MIEYKKSAAVLVFNDGNQLALQLRAAEDNSFPSHWDFSAGGGVDENESEAIAAGRELQEELGVEANVEFIAQDHCTYPAWTPGNTREVDLFLYKARHNGPFHPNPREVEKIDFFNLESIQSMIFSGEKFHPEFLFAWEKGWVV